MVCYERWLLKPARPGGILRPLTSLLVVPQPKGGRARRQDRNLSQKGGWFRVTKVRVRPDEPFEKALRRFKKKCNKEGLMQRLKEVKYYEKPSERRRRKLAKAIARQAAVQD